MKVIATVTRDIEVEVSDKFKAIDKGINESVKEEDKYLYSELKHTIRSILVMDAKEDLQYVESSETGNCMYEI